MKRAKIAKIVCDVNEFLSEFHKLRHEQTPLRTVLLNTKFVFIFFMLMKSEGQKSEMNVRKGQDTM